ncbi:MAG: hypothetical protein LBK46_06190, partial [Oscillospiraceae bacterium]|nr:hypothetical protein [Oscillospiraceae bacterium]
VAAATEGVPPSSSHPIIRVRPSLYHNHFSLAIPPSPAYTIHTEAVMETDRAILFAQENAPANRNNPRAIGSRLQGAREHRTIFTPEPLG